MAAESEIFDRLSRIEQTLARIDERTATMTANHADHETRIRALERDNDKRKGVVAAIVVGVSAAFQGIAWLLKHLFGGGAQ